MKSWVYFAKHRSRRLIKIGVSHNPRRRMSELSAIPLGCVEGTLENEQILHSLFYRYRVQGEWFKDCRAIRKYIAEQRAAERWNQVAVGPAMIVFYPNRKFRRLIEAAASGRPLGPFCLAIVVEYFKRRKKL